MLADCVLCVVGLCVTQAPLLIEGLSLHVLTLYCITPGTLYLLLSPLVWTAFVADRVHSFVLL